MAFDRDAALVEVVDIRQRIEAAVLQDRPQIIEAAIARLFEIAAEVPEPVRVELVEEVDAIWLTYQGIVTP